MSQRPRRIDSPTITLDSLTHLKLEDADRTQTPLLVANTIDLDADVVIAEPARPSHRRPVAKSDGDDWIVSATTTTSTTLSTTAVLSTSTSTSARALTPTISAPERTLHYSPLFISCSSSSPVFQSPSSHVAASSPTTATARQTPVPFTSPTAFESSKAINSADAVVALVVLTSRFSVKDFGTLQLRLPRRVVVVSHDGVIADTRVTCQAPTIITEIQEPGTFDRTIESHRPSKTYTEMVHDV